MKYLILVAMVSFGFVSNTFAQAKTTAPEAAKAAFKAKFPTVTKAKWDMEEADEWEATFKLNGKEMSANFQADGTWLETETEMKDANLPKAVKDAVAAKFAGYEAEEASLVETPGQPVAYEVELEKGETTIEALFGADGILLKQKTEEEDDDDGKD